MNREYPKGPLCTLESLIEDFRNLGVGAANVILLHSSLSSIGWVNGGAETVIEALLSVLGDEGTLVVPAHTGWNSDPSEWRAPPVPEEWWQRIRDSMPAFDTAKSRTREMGVIPELLRTWPGAKRSGHPQTSFAAVGRLAEEITAVHDLDCRLGEKSPLAFMERVGTKVLLLGVGWDKCTTLHLAEYRQSQEGRRMVEASFAAKTDDGQRRWVTVEDLVIRDEDFEEIGEEFEKQWDSTSEGSMEGLGLSRGRIGAAESKLFHLADAVGFATIWMREHRSALTGSG